MTGSRRSTEPKRPVFGIDRLGVDVLSAGLMRRSPAPERLCPARAGSVEISYKCACKMLMQLCNKPLILDPFARLARDLLRYSSGTNPSGMADRRSAK